MADEQEQPEAGPEEPATATDDAGEEPAGEGPGTDEADAHVPRDHLYQFIWALKTDGIPQAEGEEEDVEVARAIQELPERFQKPLAQEFRLGPATVERYFAHCKRCDGCYMALVEDAAGAPAPKTKAEVAEEEAHSLEERKKQFWKFWRSLSVGVVFFGGAQYLFYEWRTQNWTEKTEGAALKTEHQIKIDPLFMGAIVTVFVAAWFLAEAYVAAKDLWLDFTAWKRAVPLIGKRWAEKDKRKLD